MQDFLDFLSRLVFLSLVDSTASNVCFPQRFFGWFGSRDLGCIASLSPYGPMFCLSFPVAENRKQECTSIVYIIGTAMVAMSTPLYLSPKQYSKGGQGPRGNVNVSSGCFRKSETHAAFCVEPHRDLPACLPAFLFFVSCSCYLPMYTYLPQARGTTS